MDQRAADLLASSNTALAVTQRHELIAKRNAGLGADSTSSPAGGCIRRAEALCGTRGHTRAQRKQEDKGDLRQRAYDATSAPPIGTNPGITTPLSAPMTWRRERREMTSTRQAIGEPTRLQVRQARLPEPRILMRLSFPSWPTRPRARLQLSGTTTRAFERERKQLPMAR